MGKDVEFYKHCVKKLLTEYEESYSDEEYTKVVFDDNRMSYLVMRVGWFHEERVHSCLVHIDIQDDRIIIQANNTEDMLRSELVQMGVPFDKIELGFIPQMVQTISQTTAAHRELELA